MPEREPLKPQLSQAERFKETARELGADESDDNLDRIMGSLDLNKKSEAQQASDCAIQDAPARPAGECDCGL
jgi:hypothetical protein